MMRWRFEDADTAELYTFPKNPREMDSIHPAQKTEGVVMRTDIVRVTRSPASAFEWQFRGRLHTEQEHDDLRDWAARAHVVVRDHLNREHLVIPKGFAPTFVPARQNGTGNPWLMDYTFKTLYLGRIS